jgi:hypothetical protein
MSEPILSDKDVKLKFVIKEDIKILDGKSPLSMLLFNRFTFNALGTVAESAGQ